jgi:hypothetical protein
VECVRIITKGKRVKRVPLEENPQALRHTLAQREPALQITLVFIDCWMLILADENPPAERRNGRARPCWCACHGVKTGDAWLRMRPLQLDK